jgi:acetyl esterase/lipase
MGSSAGGHLASTALTHYDAGQPEAADPVERASSRPDIGVLCYAVITMGQYTHAGSRWNLLGDHPDPAEIAFLSNEQQVTKDTPPCFVWTTAADRAVPPENSILFADALAKNEVPFELHIYQNGSHGQGLGVRGYTPGVTPPEKLLPWTRALDDWLRLRHFIP